MRYLFGIALLCGAFLSAQISADDSLLTDPVSEMLTAGSEALDPDTVAIDSLAEFAEADTLPEVPADTLVMETVVSDTAVDEIAVATLVSETTVEEIPVAVPTPEPDLSADLNFIRQDIGPLPMELSYGYKSFRWGSPKGTLPRLAYAKSIIARDSLVIRLAVRLGPDNVEMSYHFADSGFWKVELDFMIDQNDIDKQIELFSRIEKNISEIYGFPVNTNQLFTGPSPSYNDQLDVNFTRAFYRSSWAPIPVRIELLLSSLVQYSGFNLPIFEGNHSMLKLVYYNPDYLYYQPLSERADKLPSIFDIY
ncbi:MAG: hypothetical protein ABIA75_04030 [Candidatus Neomarinimicrobiota bacterium]